MQVTAQAASFLFTRCHQPLARALQVGRQAHGMGGNANLTCQIRQEGQVCRREILALVAWSQYQLTDLFALINEWYSQWRLYQRPIGSGDLEVLSLSQGNCGVG